MDIKLRDGVRDLCCVFIVFLCCIRDVTCFNVDVKTAVVHNAPKNKRDSYFGYSVALHIDQATSWLLVGAPRAQTDQPDIVRGGAVYRCRIDTQDFCQEIPFDNSGNEKKWSSQKFQHRTIEDKSHQWFGATVQSSGENGMIVACAPRYVYYSALFDKREPVGTCFISRASSTSFQEYSPCKTYVDQRLYIYDYTPSQYDEHGLCQVGFSVLFSNNGQNMLIGAVGSWYWQGQLFNYVLTDGAKPKYSTPEGPASLDDTYMGYASAVGDFDGDDLDDYVIGTPKADTLRGRVSVFTQNLTNIHNISGEQIGTYFGYSIAVTDLNVDGLDDVIVGAPFYADYSAADSYEIGRVYIFYQTAKRKLKQHKKDILNGKESRSRFGSAITALKDINFDGANDIAIGAPYGGKGGKGVVYIYHGSSEGIITEPSQVIQATDVSRKLSAFGYSLSGGQDMDGNSYTDLLVGAYNSNRVVFFKSRPVVQVIASLQLDPTFIELKTKDCLLPDLTEVICLTIATCLKYKGIAVPEEIELDVSWTLDFMKNGTKKRSFFLDTNQPVFNKTMRLTEVDQSCERLFAYVRGDIRDKLTPIGIELKFELHEEKGRRGRRRRREVTPILDQHTSQVYRTQAPISTNCGPDNRCYPDLTVYPLSLNDTYILGDKNPILIRFSVANRKEDAYEAQLIMDIPKGLQYINIREIEATSYVTAHKLQRDDGTEYLLIDVGNPLQENRTSNFILKLNPKDVDGSRDSLHFNMKVISSNSEKYTDTADNEVDLYIPVEASATISIIGKSEPDQFVYNGSISGQQEKHIGPEVVHLYQIINLGPSNVGSVDVEIHWPSFDEEGNPLLYLTGTPEISGGSGSCTLTKFTPYNTTRYNKFDPDVHIVLKQKQTLNDIAVREKRESRSDDVQKINCSMWCTVIKCKLGKIGTQNTDQTRIAIRSKLWSNTFVKKGYSSILAITSEATATVTAMPYDNLVVEQFSSSYVEAVTLVNPSKLHLKPRPIEAWIIAVAVSAGLLILFLLIVLLWWCGFFRRRKPEDYGYENTPVYNGTTTKMDIEDKRWE